LLDVINIELRYTTWPKATLEEGCCSDTMTCNRVRVLCTPDDGCDGHPKHVEWFCSK